MAFKVGIALGGGAARGLAHIGVIAELERANIPINCVAGTSIGAIVGAIYSRRKSLDDLKMRIMSFVRSETFKNAQLRAFSQNGDHGETWVDTVSNVVKKALLYSQGITGRSIIDSEEYDKIINTLVEDINIEELQLPFAAVAADIVKSREFVFRSGSLRQAVAASSALPGIFPPMQFGDSLLVDGGWADLVPVKPCRDLGANYVIAVDIGQDMEENVDLRRSINIILRTNSVTRIILKETQLKEADYIIKPGVGKMHWADFNNFDEVIELGAKAAREAIPTISNRIKLRRRWDFF